MIPYKYGNFEERQVSDAVHDLRKGIYFLLLLVDPKTKDEYPHADVDKAFENMFQKLAGMNELLFYPKELVFVNSLLQSAQNELHKDDFNYRTYRKLILDAGSEIVRVKGV